MCVCAWVCVLQWMGKRLQKGYLLLQLRLSLHLSRPGLPSVGKEGGLTRGDDPSVLSIVRMVLHWGKTPGEQPAAVSALGSLRLASYRPGRGPSPSLAPSSPAALAGLGDFTPGLGKTNSPSNVVLLGSASLGLAPCVCGIQLCLCAVSLSPGLWLPL